jgi:hypothetical protein
MKTKTRTDSLTLILTPEQRRKIEQARAQLEAQGVRASLSRVAVAALERGLREPLN